MKKEKEYWDNLHKQIADTKADLEEAERQMDESQKKWFEEKGDDETFQFWSLFQNDQKNYNFLKNLLVQLEIEAKTPLYATYFGYSDRHAYEVIERKSPNKFIVRRLKATNHGGIGEQDWTFESDPAQPTLEIRRKRNKMGWVNGNMFFLLSDEPYEYYDWNF